MKPQLKTFMPPIPGINPIDALLAKDRAEESEECTSLIHKIRPAKMAGWDREAGKIVEADEPEEKGGIKFADIQAGFDSTKGKYVQPRIPGDGFRMRGQCCSICPACGKRIKAQLYLRHVRTCHGS